ncbi:hypothetical protein [Adhaeribacter rhizoryzae]|uniref:Uncharacterized protein n=1 Tax=Adhaeribacter rhizoryzae TaxID=2607907 RepID=A0A5M6DPS0_9BACT|nr:hypothetical protein [Adhaeribacter rhizoryzae]KAA5549478.1 hypothetical protein F0145_02515 [Adhaeribacter rhizoryzae]
MQIKRKISVRTRVTLSGLVLFYLLATALRFYTPFKPINSPEVSSKWVAARGLPAKQPLLLQEAAIANTIIFGINSVNETWGLPAIFSAKILPFISRPIFLHKVNFFLASRLLFRARELPNGP